MPIVPEALTRFLFRSSDTSRVPGGRRAQLIGSPLAGERETPDTIRKSSRVGPLIAYDTLGEPVWSPRDYSAFAREGFMQNAIVYRCVRMISEAAASIPLLLYEGDNEIERHPLLDLLRQPSLDHTGADFLESWYGFLLVAGNAYVEAVAVNGEIRELHNLRPDRMKVIPGLDGWPEGYEYSAGGKSVRFLADVVDGVRPIFHTRLFHPANDHYGMSPIEAAATAIDIHNTASGWNKALLDNSARPSGALVYAAANGQMTDAQFARLKAELETNFQGAAHAGRPLLLEGGLDWKPLSLSPKDMDFIQAKNAAAREIALSIGVPPQLLGIPGDNTWTSPGYIAGLNPVSTLTGQRMIDLDHIHIYCWDARPFPAFPYETQVWGDGANWALGHWLNGRMSSTPLNETVARILSDYGFADFDASGLNGTVPGYVIDRVMAARDALQPLELAYFFDSVESGGKISFRHRGLAGAVAAYDTTGLVERRAGDVLLSVTRGQETELPASAKLRFLSAEDDYQQAVAEARRLTGASGRVAQADLPIVLDDGLSGGIAESWLFETWAARERAEFALPPSALALEPGDVVQVTADGRSRALRITDIAEHGVREIEARSIDSDVYERVSLPGRTPQSQPVIQVGSPALAFLDLPLLATADTPEYGYAAAVQVPWPGSVAVYASAQTSGYQLKALVPAAATFGVLDSPLDPGPEGRIDWRARVRVKLSHGALQSADMITMLGGENAAAVRASNGAWEVLQFLTATLVAPQTYELSGLLRAQGGSEGAMRAPVAAGATFVLLNSAVTRIPLALSELNLPYNWRYGPGNRDIGDASYQTVPYTFTGVGLRPLSPVHVRAKRSANDIELSWVRRTRIGGDSWEVADVPLAEDAERYEIDILDGATVKRTITATAPHATYTAAEQIADFGGLQASVSVNVVQVSSVYGRGERRTATV